jgi:ribose 5-phosphate isomerase RpiB
MKKGLKIAIGADHAGFDYKQAIIGSLDVAEIKDFGTYSSASADYPDFAHPVPSLLKAAILITVFYCAAAPMVWQLLQTSTRA